MMYLLGFLSAGLLALAAVPALWRRAERLSIRRLELLMPLSPREVVAERDALRADFAVALRRMERAIEDRVAGHVQAQADLGRERIDGADLRRRLGALAGDHAAQGARLQAAQVELAGAEAQLAALQKALYDVDLLATERGAALAARQAVDEDRASPAPVTDEAAGDLALRLKLAATVHALQDARAELDARHAAPVLDLDGIADLSDPRLRAAIHEVGVAVARLAAGADQPRALEETPAA